HCRLAGGEVLRGLAEDEVDEVRRRPLAGIRASPLRQVQFLAASVVAMQLQSCPLAVEQEHPLRAEQTQIDLELGLARSRDGPRAGDGANRPASETHAQRV